MKVLVGVCAVAALAGLLAWQFSFEAVPADGRSVDGSDGRRESSSESGKTVDERAPVAGDERVEVPGAALPYWLTQLLYGPAGGAAGYAEILSGVRQGTEKRDAAFTLLFEELDADNRGDGKLQNVELPLAFLLDIEPPPATAVSAKDAYLRVAAKTVPHTRMMDGLRSWPLDEATRARILELLDEVATATSHEERVTALEKLFAMGAVGAKAFAVDLVKRCHKDGSRTAAFVHAMLDASTDPKVYSMVLNEAASTQIFAGESRASSVVNMVALGFRTYLGNELGMQVDPRRRIEVQSAVMGLATNATVKHALGLGVAAAVALGGGNQDDPRIAQYLSNASKEWPTLAANTALVNLGYSTDPTGYLGYVPWRLTPPTDMQRMIRHADYIAGLSIALNRHPEQESVVLPYVEETLRSWRNSRYELLVCEDVLRLIQSLKLRGAEPALRELQAANVKRVSKLAGQILAEWQ